jgi:hypothetical protein
VKSSVSPIFVFVRYASFRESSECIHPNRHTDPQGVPELDLRVNLVRRRGEDWVFIGFDSVCAGVENLLNSDVAQSLQISCWV